MSYNNFGTLFPDGHGHDRVRGVKIPPQSYTIDTMDEAFTSENWIIRIYKVKDLDNLDRDHVAAGAFNRGLKKKVHKKRGARVLRVD
jgi:dolichyl-diphosphooligosaccharide--protein glycosyltransferase